MASSRPPMGWAPEHGPADKPGQDNDCRQSGDTTGVEDACAEIGHARTQPSVAVQLMSTHPCPPFVNVGRYRCARDEHPAFAAHAGGGAGLRQEPGPLVYAGDADPVRKLLLSRTDGWIADVGRVAGWSSAACDRAWRDGIRVDLKPVLARLGPSARLTGSSHAPQGVHHRLRRRGRPVEWRDNAPPRPATDCRPQPCDTDTKPRKQHDFLQIDG